MNLDAHNCGPARQFGCHLLLGRRSLYSEILDISWIALGSLDDSGRSESSHVQADSPRSRRTLVADLGVTSVSHVGTNGRGCGWYRVDD
ncbi:hypothetical protein BJD99_05795 [Rhodococcus sp. 1163]|nr:hypothetical protein BJD99_05795 [Rhodococcus sp. 1163]